MSIIHGTPSHDRTLKEAEDAAQRDFARLLHGHSPSWGIDTWTGSVLWACSCNSPGPYNHAALDKHVMEAVRKARGPVRPPKR
jgi:predicted metal-binding transcription factor (methanogenesis marker protein 9)